VSVDLEAGDGPLENSRLETVTDRFPAPIAHGCGIVATIDDVEDPDAPIGERGGLYDAAMEFWHEEVEDPENQPLYVDGFDPSWLEYALRFRSSRWKAGEGEGDDYTPWYEYHISLREKVEQDGRPTYRKVETSLNIDIQPQYPGLVYSDGNPLDDQLVYGTGSRFQVDTTYPDDGYEITRRAHEAIGFLLGPDAFDLEDVVEESHRLRKVESHSRAAEEYTGALVRTIEDTKQLIQWGGSADVQAQQRAQNGSWVLARTSSDRFDLLGFASPDFETYLKCYMADDAANREDDDPMSQPKIEAGFDGAGGGRLPHVSAFDTIMQYLRTIVATHCRWAGVDARDLVADDHFAGPRAPEFSFERPTGRKEMLREHWHEAATQLQREAIDKCIYPYDILRVIAEQQGASYDTLVERTGLARSTVRHHVARLAERGIVARLSNPTIVVFVSELVHGKAMDLLNEARPGQTAEDLNRRAEKRRERRESTGTEETEDTTDGEESDDAPATKGFEFLARLEAEIGDVERLLRVGQLDGEDVKVRRDALPRALR
jgi:DNA-binding MarR family transcriptional regulator